MTPFYDHNGITIFCNDCLEIMPQLEMEFDAIIADWPYGTTACAWDIIIPLDKMWAECKRIIKRDRAISLMCSQPFTTILISSNFDWFRYEWIWDKTRATGGTSASNRPMKAHEGICVFSKTPHVYNPQMEQWSRAEIKQMRKRDFIVPPKGPMIFAEHIAAGRQTKISNGKTPRSIIRIPAMGSNDKDRTHPTQKPVALLSYLIRTYTNPGELILDNTMGSGTTLVAAQNEGRQAIGIEISEEYCRIAVERLRQPSFFSLPSMKEETKAEQLNLLGE